MTGCNPDNEYVKRRYFHHMREAKGLAPATVDHACRAIAEFEAHTDWRDFKRHNVKAAVQFKKALLAKDAKRSAQLSSRATIYSKLNHLKLFFQWLAEQPGYRTRLKIADADYFHLSRHDARLAQERPEHPAPSLEQIHRAIMCMPFRSDVELRDRALMAFLILTGARVNAVCTFKLRHLLRNRLGIRQDARDVRTKGSKTFNTYFFPLGDDLRGIFLDYVDHLRGNLGWTDGDPLFPTTAQSKRPGHLLEVLGLEKEHWRTADPVRKICRHAFDGASLPYYNPHSFRRTLALLAEERCRTPEELKAWSQNLGHNQVLTTLVSYGAVRDVRQSEIINSLHCSSPVELTPQLRRAVEQLYLKISRSGGPER